MSENAVGIALVAPSDGEVLRYKDSAEGRGPSTPHDRSPASDHAALRM